MKRKMMAWMLVFALVVTFLPVTSLALSTVASGSCGNAGNNVSWLLDSSGLLTISGTGDMEDQYIPWYGYSDSIARVIIESGVTSIGAYSFMECRNITDVQIPSTVVSIGAGAFYDCQSLNRVTLPGSLTGIGEYAFAECNGLTYVTIPSGVKHIEEGAFYKCKQLASVTFGVGVETIGLGAFYQCVALKTVRFSDSVQTIGDMAFSECTGLNQITIPNSVSIIGESAFEGCVGLSAVRFGSGLKKVGESAFWSCALTAVEIPSGVTEIGAYAFSECMKLTSVSIPASVTVIDSGAFSWCGRLESIGVDANNSAFCNDGTGALYSKDMATIVQLPGAFSGKFTIPDTVTDVAAGAFEGCSGLTGVTFSKNVRRIGDYAFYGCEFLTEVTPLGVIQEIGNYAFYSCGALAQLALRDGLLVVGDYAFGMCYSLTDFTVPKSVDTIGEGVFSWCMGLNEIQVDPLNAHFTGDDGALYNKEKTALYAVPGAFSGTFIVPDTICVIENSAFEGCYDLTEVVLPAALERIGTYAFYGCTALDSVVIPAAVKKIDVRAFGSCLALQDVTFLGDAPEFGSDAFDSVEANAYYSAGNNTWTSQAMEKCGGDLKWIPWTQGTNDLYVIDAYRSGSEFTYPTLPGFVFAGWYLDEALTVPVGKEITSGFAYARFVDADVLSVKWQVTAETTAATPSTTLRLVTTVDSLNYSNVGFRFQIGAGKVNTRISSTVYRQIKSRSEGTVFNYKPTVFHETSRYFLTRTVTQVPNSVYDLDWTVTPFWTTLDGTVVDGLSRTFQINDFYSK